MGWKQRRKKIGKILHWIPNTIPQSVFTDVINEIITQEQSMLAKAEEEKEELVEAINDYLEWGCKTSSDRDMFDNRFEKLLQKHEGKNEK